MGSKHNGDEGQQLRDRPALFETVLQESPTWRVFKFGFNAGGLTIVLLAGLTGWPHGFLWVSRGDGVASRHQAGVMDRQAAVPAYPRSPDTY